MKKSYLMPVLFFFFSAQAIAFDISLQAGYQVFDAGAFNDSIKAMHEEMLSKGYTGSYYELGSYAVNYSLLFCTEIFKNTYFHARMNYMPVWPGMFAEYYYPTPDEWLAYDIIYYVNHYYLGAGLGYGFKFSDAITVKVKFDAGIDAIHEIIYDDAYPYNHDGNPVPGYSWSIIWAFAYYAGIDVEYEFITDWLISVSANYNSVGQGPAFSLGVGKKF